MSLSSFTIFFSERHSNPWILSATLFMRMNLNWRCWTMLWLCHESLWTHPQRRLAERISDRNCFSEELVYLLLFSMLTKVSTILLPLIFLTRRMSAFTLKVDEHFKKSMAFHYIIIDSNSNHLFISGPIFGRSCTELYTSQIGCIWLWSYRCWWQYRHRSTWFNQE